MHTRVSVSISEELLKEIDEQTPAMVTRSAWVEFLLSKALDVKVKQA